MVSQPVRADGLHNQPATATATAQQEIPHPQPRYQVLLGPTAR